MLLGKEKKERGIYSVEHLGVKALGNGWWRMSSGRLQLWFVCKAAGPPGKAVHSAGEAVAANEVPAISVAELLLPERDHMCSVEGLCAQSHGVMGTSWGVLLCPATLCSLMQVSAGF